MKRPRELLFPPISADHAAAIGYVAAHWSLIEEMLGVMLYQAISLHTIPGYAVIAEISTLQRLNMISALLNLTGNKNWTDAWSDLSVAMDALRNRRNDAIHSTWQVAGPEHFRTRMKAKGKLSITRGIVTTAELNQLSEDLLDMFWELTQFWVKLLQAGVGKIINQYHPPGWPVHGPQTTPPTPSPGPRSQPRNPKRERQRRRRELRRNQEHSPT
jgi:hypothetical protein